MTSRMKRNLARGLTCLAVALFPLACGGSTTAPDGQMDASGGQGVGPGVGGSFVGSSGGQSSIANDLGAEASGGSGLSTGGPSEGGHRVLTAEELATIQGGSCADWSQEGENMPAILQLVVDVSLSMQEPAPGGMPGENRWDVTREALSLALEDLPGSAAVGILYYPNRNVTLSPTQVARPVTECVAIEDITPIGVLGEATSAQRATLEQSLTDADVNGYTPTHDAYKYALEQSLIPYTGAGQQKFMLLITDGAPTRAEGCLSAPAPPTCPQGCGPTPPATPCPDDCVMGPGGNVVVDVDTQPIIDAVTAAAGQGIRTFLIGSPGSEVGSDGNDKRPWLSKAAMAGGTAKAGCAEAGPNFCHLDMTQEANFSTALTEGLAAIVGEVVDTCTFVAPSPPAGHTLDPNTLSLIAVWGDGTATAFLRDDVGTCDAGWNFDATGQMVLCPATCDLLKAGQGATVEVSSGCTDIIK
jgi:hypothetical protein